MRYVCPKDVEDVVGTVKIIQLEEVGREAKEGIWLVLALALLRKKTKEGWSDRHGNAARKLVLVGGWVQTRLFDIDRSDESKCQACHKEEGTEKHRLYHCPEWNEVRREIPEAFRKWEQKSRTSKNKWKWRRGICCAFSQ